MKTRLKSPESRLKKPFPKSLSGLSFRAGAVIILVLTSRCAGLDTQEIFTSKSGIQMVCDIAAGVLIRCIELKYHNSGALLENNRVK